MSDLISRQAAIDAVKKHYRTHDNDLLELIALHGQCMGSDRKMTNADMIRAMSDEELAANLMCHNEMGIADIPYDKSDQCNCRNCLLDWLRQSAMEEAR